MADYVAHMFFGMRVLETLPLELRKAALEDSQVFQMGLYGPDPLIFSLRTKWISDYLHKNWKVRTLPVIAKLIKSEHSELRSFAAGYYLHMVLDDVVHPNIYRWMEEGYHHFRMEVALDLLILRESGRHTLPHLVIKGKERTARAAASLILPADAGQYLFGLRNMSLLCRYLYWAGKNYPRKLTEGEKQRTRRMRTLLEEAVKPTAEQLAALLGEIRETQPVGSD